jgi:hypothetical protein
MAAVFLPAVAAGALLALAVQLPSLDAAQRWLPELLAVEAPQTAGSLRRPPSIDGRLCLPTALPFAAAAAPPGPTEQNPRERGSRQQDSREPGSRQQDSAGLGFLHGGAAHAGGSAPPALRGAQR